MNTRRLSVFFSILAAITLVVSGAESSYAQGKGNGGKHGGGGNPHGGGNRGGGPPAGFPGGGGNPGRGNGKHGGFVQQAPQVPQAYQNFPSRGRGAEKRGGGQVIMVQPQQRVYVQQQPNVYYGQMPQRGKGKAKHQNPYIVQQQYPVWGGQMNRGQQRREEVHARNAERKAYKEQEKAFKREQKAIDRYARQPQNYQVPVYPQVTPRYYDDSRARYYEQQRLSQQYRPQQYAPQPYVQQQYIRPQYVDPGYAQQYYTQPYDFYAWPYYQQGYDTPYYGNPADNDGDFDVADILRNIVFTVLGGGDIADGLGGLPAQYGGDGYYGQAYPQYASDRYAYSPAGSGYRGAYDDPYGFGYANENPLGFLSRDTGDDMFREIFSQLLAVGYEQGYRQGLAARGVRDDRDAFYDPYAYDNTMYDPYSSSLGENRRFLSEGYELGYQDAMNNVRGYEQFDNQGGDIDLVSILIGAVSQVM